MKTVYLITRKRRGDKGHEQDLTVKAKEVSTNTGWANLERWREQLQLPFNRCDPHTIADISEAEQELEIELGPITV